VLDSGLTMKQCFKEFDKDNSGCIEREEMKLVLDGLHVAYTNVSGQVYILFFLPSNIKYHFATINSLYISNSIFFSSALINCRLSHRFLHRMISKLCFMILTTMETGNSNTASL
jgi:hypothetical protein